ncbi:MAG: metal-dependent transcriptional regulator [Nitrososphaeria archaeon]|nr:metal-dependent transcriptional regulator [Nitrososphaeria archaeon]
MPNLKYSKQIRTYLRRIYTITVEEHGETTSGELAIIAGVKMPTAVEVVKKLEEMGFVYRKPWGPVKLTENGIKVAERIVFRHRIIETFLYRFLGLDYESACYQASLMEDVDDRVVYAMCSKLGHPCECIHGRRIPHFSHEGERK